MDHTKFLAALPDTDRAELNTSSDAAAARHLALYLAPMAALAVVIALGLPFWQLALVPLGILIVFLFTLNHEAIHRTVFATRWMNDPVARICGFCLLLPTDWFRYFHLAHHRHTHDPDKDPELAAPQPETWLDYVRHVSGLPVWWSQTRTLFRNAFLPNDDTFVPASGREKVRREARLMLALYASLAAGSLILRNDFLFWIWIVPALLGQPFLRLYLLAEHGRCPHVANMFENTRTTLTNSLVRFIAWNMPYHAEHHACPTVPFHRLPDLHKLAIQHIQNTSNGYVAFNREFANGLSAQP